MYANCRSVLINPLCKTWVMPKSTNVNCSYLSTSYNLTLSNYIDVSCSYEPQTKPWWPLGDVMNAFIPKYIYLILSDLDLYDTSWEHLDKNKLMVKL
jgi:hypothetical protein